ncbi:ArpU family phage packaging/lysis transcriptional regulator [Streptococcus sp. HMSC070B10]|uniref:ArpU family phage packaging/lysis transcriptional regulator n=1 Tax=Streptococcus sp. HMSC070B10 TaxID=1715092 RepID=UPI0008A54180|nr:ArpU family phage packaging/lysis transcriptional regulator [Streptococcus sp. HMSC070B10]OFO01872.1 ArpU family transcriptional regulator [Streptococcus sp. HMSC070B10]
MPFFPDINEIKTKENAKKILKGYPRWRRVANDKNGQKVTTTYSFMPRNPGSDTTSQVEKLAIRKVDAEMELDAIEQAVSGLHDPLYRRILFEKYLQWSCKKDETIATDLSLSESSYYDILDKSLMAFAELYRNGEQIEILE